jgi:hypothetical protein
MWGWQLSYNRRGANSSVGSSLRQGGKKVWLQRVWEIRSNWDKCLNSTKSLGNIIMQSWNLMWMELEDNFQVSFRVGGRVGGECVCVCVCVCVEKELGEARPYTRYFTIRHIYIYIYSTPINILSRYVHTHTHTHTHTYTHTHIYIYVATCFSYIL